MIAIVRLRGSMKMNGDARDTLNMLGLRRVNTVAVLPDNAVAKGMILKVQNFVTWGELSGDIKIEKTARLKPAKGGLKSVKTKYPKGDLGYRGAAINDLIKRMM